MHSSRCFSALAVLVLATSATLPAQVMASSFGQMVPVGSPQAPYTLTRTSTTVQTLADGTTITQTRTEKMARDSQGRGYNETRQTQPFGPDGQPFDWIHALSSIPWPARISTGTTTRRQRA
jgi:hypothetical protein